MAQIPISQTTLLPAGSVASGDEIPIVDISDTSQASTGTTKHTTAAGLVAPAPVAYYPPPVTLTDGATIAVDWTASNVQYLAASNNARTFTFTAPGGYARLQIVALSGGAVTHIWPASVLWSGGVAPTASAAGKYDVFAFTYVPATGKYLGAYVTNF